MSEIMFIVIILLIILIPFGVHYSRLRSEKLERQTIKRLCSFLFPGEKESAEERKRSVVAELMTLTKNRFTEEEVLDYYLKIKGLQLIDLNSFCDPYLRKFLMQPTLISLSYAELVPFYERYLNMTPVQGVSAT